MDPISKSNLLSRAEKSGRRIIIGILITFGRYHLPYFSCFLIFRTAENLVHGVLLFQQPTLSGRIIHFDEIVVFIDHVLARWQFTKVLVRSWLLLRHIILMLLVLVVQLGSRVGSSLWPVAVLYVTRIFHYLWSCCICIHRDFFARSQIE